MIDLLLFKSLSFVLFTLSIVPHYLSWLAFVSATAKRHFHRYYCSTRLVLFCIHFVACGTHFHPSHVALVVGSLSLSLSLSLEMASALATSISFNSLQLSHKTFCDFCGALLHLLSMSPDSHSQATRTVATRQWVCGVYGTRYSFLSVFSFSFSFSLRLANPRMHTQSIE